MSKDYKQSKCNAIIYIITNNKLLFVLDRKFNIKLKERYNLKKKSLKICFENLQVIFKRYLQT